MQSASEFPQTDHWSRQLVDRVDSRQEPPDRPSQRLDQDWFAKDHANDNFENRTDSANQCRLALEEVLPRDTAVYMISLYFDYVSAT